MFMIWLRTRYNAAIFVSLIAWVLLAGWWSSTALPFLMAAANTIPIWGKEPQVSWHEAVLTANTTVDLTAGTIYLVFTADATNGSYLQRVRFRSKGTNVASVGRIWINNGATTATAANNALFDEVTLPATTVSQTAAQPVYEVPINIALPAGYRVYVTLGTTVAAGFHVTGIGAKY